MPGESHQDFALRRSEWFIIGLLVLLLAALSITSFRFQTETVGSLVRLSDNVSITNNIIRAEQESLQFASAFERWLSGITTLRNLQIRKAELDQTLAAHDNTGASTSARVSTEYLEALRILDGYTNGAPPGFLPPDDQTIVRLRSADALQSFIIQARAIATFNSDSNAKPLTTLFADEITRQQNRNATVLVAFGLVFLVAGLFAFSRSRDYRKIRIRLEGERQSLDKLNDTLQQIESELQLRIEKDRVDRIDREWIDTGVDSISAKFSKSLTPDLIAKFMVEGLGRVLRPDSVISYSFADLPWPRILKQWHQRPDSHVDESVFAEYESSLFASCSQLWSENRVSVVDDSNDIQNSSDRIPEILEVTLQWARSWVVVPFGEGTRVVGCVLVAMLESSRVWSAAEIELIQKVSVAAADTFIQVRLFRLSMQIVENDAEVSRLVELDRVKSDFIENMNHELRTPLASIIGYLELALDGVDAGTEPELVSSLKVVQRNARRLQLLIENMMQVSKTDFENVPLAIGTVDVGHVLGDVVNSLRLSAEDRAVMVTLRLDSPAGDLIIDGDSGRLEQVFVNLISNSIKFTPREGTVTVVARRAHPEGHVVEVQVADTGIGIPAEEFSNVFKRFFRASTATKASIPGFGIGLSLVQSIVREHRGTISFDSTVGMGTVFTVTLPARYTSMSQVGQTT